MRPSRSAFFRAALFAALAKLPAQTLITGTDAETFLPLAEVAEGLRTGGGTLHADARFGAGGMLAEPTGRAT